MHNSLKKLRAYKSNALIQTSGVVIDKDDLTEREQKIVMFMASQVRAESKPEDWYIFEIKRFCEIAGIKRNGELYSDAADTLFGLQAKRVMWVSVDEAGHDVIKGANFIVSPIVSSAGVIKYKLDENLLPHYKKKLAEGFTVIDLLDYMGIRGKYSVALYELMLSWRKKGTVTYTLAQIIDLLKFPANYAPGDIIRRIESAVKEINLKSKTISVEVKIKRAAHRKIEGFTFVITTIAAEAKTYEAELESIGQLPLIGAAEIDDAAPGDLFAEMVALGIPIKLITDSIEQYGEPYCSANLQYARRYAKTDLPSYYKKAISDNYANYSEAATVVASERPGNPDPNCPICEGRGYYIGTSPTGMAKAIDCKCKGGQK